jgi:hypothetical protein
LDRKFLIWHETDTGTGADTGMGLVVVPANFLEHANDELNEVGSVLVNLQCRHREVQLESRGSYESKSLTTLGIKAVNLSWRHQPEKASFPQLTTEMLKTS